MSNPIRPAASETANPIGALLIGSVIPALIATAVLAAGASLRGLDAVLSVLVGAGIALAALIVAPILHLLCRNLDPSLVLGIVVLAYCLVVGLAWVGYSQVSDASWLIGQFAGGGVAVANVMWVAGHIRAALRLRQPLYSHLGQTAGR